MSAYMLVEIDEILDADTYAEYRKRVATTVYKYGGRYVVRGGSILALSGDWNPARMIILEFPTMERLLEWNASDDYQEVAPLRLRATRGRAIAVQGYDRDADADAAAEGS